jgi:hypothetical protein
VGVGVPLKVVGVPLKVVGVPLKAQHMSAGTMLRIFARPTNAQQLAQHHFGKHASAFNVTSGLP